MSETGPLPGEVPARARAAIWTRALTVWGVLVAALATVSYFLVDQPVAEFIHGLPRWVSELGSRVTVLGRSEIYLIALPALYVLCVMRRWRRGAELAWLGFWASSSAGLVVDGIKFLLGRCRPELWFKEHAYGFVFFHTDYDHTGFPSGHSATIAAICAVLWLAWPRGRAAWVILAVAVAGSRVMTGSHYPSDVLVGVYLGVAATVILRAILAGGWLPGFGRGSTPAMDGATQISEKAEMPGPPALPAPPGLPGADRRL